MNEDICQLKNCKNGLPSIYKRAAVVDWRVKKFIKTLTPDLVKNVICFSSAAIIDSNYPKVRSMLEARGITVDDR